MRLRIAVLSVISILILATYATSQTFVETWTGFTANGTGDTLSADSTWNKNGGCYLATDPSGDFILGTPYDSFAPFTDPCNPSDDTLFVTNVVGDGTENCTSTWNDPAGGTCSDPLGCFANNHRAEVIPQSTAIRPDINEEHWLGWRIWVPTNFPATISQSLIVTQAICAPSKGVDWDLRIHTNGQWRHTQRRTLSTETRNDDVFDFGPIQRGTWNNFVHRWVRKVDNTGVGELWYNGTKVYTYTGISTQSTEPACLVKHGIYHGTYIGTSFGGKTYQLVFDDFKVAFGANQYATVAPTKTAGACEAPPPPLVFPAPGNNVIDDFDRADESPVDGGIWSQGIVQTQGNRIVSNVLVRVQATIGESYITAPMGADQDAYFTMPNATNHNDGTNLKLLACLQGTLGTSDADGYVLNFQKSAAGTDVVSFEELTNGVFVQIGSNVNQELTNGHKMGLRVTPNGNLEGYLDTGSGWTSIGTQVDGTPLDCSSTVIGVRTANSLHQVDDFGGGAYVSGANNLLLNPIIFFD